jgi:hypothetical protein
MIGAAVIAILFLGVVIFVSQRSLGKQLAVIHDLVNSNLARVTTDFEIAKTRIETLERHITDVEHGRE